MQDNIDLDAGLILGGTETLASMGRHIYETMLAVAQGALTKAERLGHREFSVSRYPSPRSMRRQERRPARGCSS